MTDKTEPVNAPVAVPDRAGTEAAAALAAWLQATPEQRLELLKEMWQMGKILTGKVAPWDLPEYK